MNGRIIRSRYATRKRGPWQPYQQRRERIRRRSDAQSITILGVSAALTAGVITWVLQ